MRKLNKKMCLSEPKWKCVYCGREFYKQTPHRCNTGFRKKKLKWIKLINNMNNNIEDYVTLKTALKLKELGCPLTQFHYNDPKFNEYGALPHFGNSVKDEYYLIPTLYQVQKWLRNEKNLQIFAAYRGESWYYVIMNGRITKSIGKDIKTYEQALEIGIDKALDLLSNDCKNIFDGAKFGDKFRTRDGKPALYLHQCNGSTKEIDTRHHVVIFTNADTYANNGKLWPHRHDMHEDNTDIVGKWEE